MKRLGFGNCLSEEFRLQNYLGSQRLDVNQPARFRIYVKKTDSYTELQTPTPTSPANLMAVSAHCLLWTRIHRRKSYLFNPAPLYIIQQIQLGYSTGKYTMSNQIHRIRPSLLGRPPFALPDSPCMSGRGSTGRPTPPRKHTKPPRSSRGAAQCPPRAWRPRARSLGRRGATRRSGTNT